MCKFKISSVLGQMKLAQLIIYSNHMQKTFVNKSVVFYKYF